jgi:hypothetical protein
MSMTQKYETRPSDSIYGSPPANQPSARPSHAHRVSLPVIPSSNYTGIGSSRSQGVTSSRPIPDNRQNRTVENISGTREGGKDASRHPSICGCEECSATGYTSPALRQQQQQRVFSENLLLGSAQDTIKSTRSDRRVSMPMPASSNRY